jgi:N-methylhydantoinase B
MRAEDTGTLARDLDPFTVEIVQNALESTAREMSTVMLRTSHAPIFSEGKDFSCALYDSTGNALAQAHDCPIHLANIQFSLVRALEQLEGEPSEGDIVIANDPYLGGSHLPDITLFKPIFVNGALVFFAANRAHHVDVGGGAPGSFVATATDIYQEGIRLPPVRLHAGGNLNRDLVKVLLRNVRNPDYMWGDLNAQIAALVHAEHRILGDLIPRFGVATLLAARAPILDQSERRLRDAIAQLRGGVFVASDHLDDDGIEARPLLIKVSVRRQAATLIIDFTGSSPQARGPVNAVFAVTAGAAYIAVLSSLDPNVPVNAGCYRPIRVIAPEGTIVNPKEPAPCVAGNTYTSIRIIDTVRRALIEAGAPHVAAGHGEHAQVLAGGTDPTTGEGYVFYDMPVGGWGATPDKDGEDALFTLNANCENTPVEVFETRFPWRIRRMELRRNSGGRGKHRGGRGMVKEYELVRGEALLSLASDRVRFRPYGLNGGGSGSNARFELTTRGRRRQLPSKVTNVRLEPGDVVTVRTSGGGGLGREETAAVRHGKRRIVNE